MMTQRRIYQNGETAPDGFRTVLGPLIAAGRERLRRELAARLSHFAHHPIADLGQVESLLYEKMRSTLKYLVTPTLVLELNVARLQGELTGDTPEERYAAFIERLRQPAVRQALATEYPLLFQLAQERIDTWVVVSLELIERLCADWSELCVQFDAGQPGALIDIDWVQRTTKRSGRSVAVLTFASGLQVVYKPRSLAVERHFQEVLLWLNQCNVLPMFRTLKLLDRPTYGWMEWIEAEPCPSEAAVRRFYQRQGAYLALLLALEATDFHLSNIIAAGEQPLLIDLEALFHPRPAPLPAPPLEAALERLLDNSVLRIGLLPEPDLADDAAATPFDLSGLAGTGGQQTPYTAPTWVDRGTDTMRLVRQHYQIGGGENQPTLCGQPVQVTDYWAEIDHGFATAYRLLLERRAEWLGPHGLLARFADDEVRVVPRSGRRYGALLDDSLHPDLLRNTAARERFFQRLQAGVADEPHLAALIPHEQAALWVGDAPLFATRANSRAIYTSSGVTIADFFPQSGLAAAEQRLLVCDETDLAHQRWLIQAALATVAPLRAASPPTTIGQPLPASAPANLRDQLITQARTIGQRLEQTAVCTAGEASWLGLAVVARRRWQLDPLAWDLYNGLPGVALFLAHLGQQTGEARWTALARATVATLQRYVAEAVTPGALADADLGAFEGLGGAFYGFTHLGLLWQEPALLHLAQSLVTPALAALAAPAEDEAIGLADGWAGLLAGVLALYQAQPTTETLALARQVGEQLLTALSRSRPQAEPAADNPLSPFATLLYEPAGAIGPLFTLAQVSGAAKFQKRAAKLLASLKVDAGDPGTILAALQALPWLADTEQRQLRQAIKMALPALLSQRLGCNHSLGHGDLGYLDLLGQAATLFSDAALQTECARYAAALSTDLATRGWVLGLPLGVESPGSMTGLAGIGYGLLRLAAPAQTPSLFALGLPAVADGCNGCLP